MSPEALKKMPAAIVEDRWTALSDQLRLYKSQSFRDWSVDGHKAGEVKTAGPLTFATVRGAGHMISLILPV